MTITRPLGSTFLLSELLRPHQSAEQERRARAEAEAKRARRAAKRRSLQR